MYPSFYIFLAFFGFPLLYSLTVKNSTTFMIDRFGTNLPPKNTRWYVSPPRWMRKLFKITKWSFIPRYLYFSLFLSLFFAALAPINSIIYYVIFRRDPSIYRLLILITSCIGIIYIIFFAIFTAIAKKH